VQNNLIANDLNVLPLICFEIAFAEQLGANFTDETSLLLTVSNDAWFGDSHGPHQHMEIARMRALEFGRPLLRSTNNGVTAVTDHLGNIQVQAPQFEQYVLKAEVKLVNGRTPYSQYWKLIHWLIPLLLIFIPLLVNFSLRKSR
jgi:apolipoprotein N-acyltransferase